MNDPRNAEVVAWVHWDASLKAIEDVADRAPASYFAEYDAKKLESVAKTIRNKLEEQDEHTEHNGPDV